MIKEESTFGLRGKKTSEQEQRTDAIYAEKREMLCRLRSIKLGTPESESEFNRLKKLLCCCSDDYHINSGCVVCGVRSRSISTGSSLNSKHDASRQGREAV